MKSKNRLQFLKESMELRQKLSKPGLSRLGRKQFNDVLSQINTYLITFMTSWTEILVRTSWTCSFKTMYPRCPDVNKIDYLNR